MELVLNRPLAGRTATATIGEMTVNGAHECWICEDKYRGDNMPADKVPGETAIPCGRYKVSKTWSKRFQRDMYLVHDVPGFEGIRIHAGNKSKDTEGCLLPGRTKVGATEVGESVLAVKALEAKLDAIGCGLPGKEPIWLTVKLGA